MIVYLHIYCSIYKHTLSVVSVNGTAATEFEIKATSVKATEPTKPNEPTKPDTDNTDKEPQTGDNSNMALWIALLFVSGVGIAGTTVYSKKKKAMR